jgi:hypothetical protein
MPTPMTKRTIGAFYRFAACWLVAAAGCAVVAVASGYNWPRVARAAFSVGLMPIVTGYSVMVVSKWMHQPPED